MNSIVQFIVKLRAQAGNLREVAEVSTRQLERVRRSAERTSMALRNAFSVRGLGRGLMGIPGMQALANPYALLAAGIGVVTKIGSEAETAAKIFSTLVGEEEKALGVLKEIRDYAHSSPFGLVQLNQSAKILMNYEVAAENVVDTIKRLGDISGGNAENLRSLALAYGQVVSNGRLMGQERLQLVNAGFNPISELAKMTGKTTGELTKMMENGEISAKNVTQAIIHATSEGGRFYNVINNLSETWSAKFFRVLGKLQERVVKLFDRLKPALEVLLSIGSRLIPALFDGINGVLDVIQAVVGFIRDWSLELKVLAGFIALVTVVLTAGKIATMAYTAWMGIVTVATKAWTAVQWLLNAALTANPIGIVIVAIGALVSAIVYCWYKFDGFRAFLYTMWDAMKGFGGIIKDYVIDRINELLEGIGAVGKAIKLLFEGDFTGAASAVGEAIDKFSGGQSATNLVQSTRTLTQGLGGTYNAHLQREQAKQAQGTGPLASAITTPGLKGSSTSPQESVIFGQGKDGKGGKSGNAIATGGQRNTTINMSIGKLIESINVRMADRTDSAELEEAVLRSVNRALAMATSTE